MKIGFKKNENVTIYKGGHIKLRIKITPILRKLLEYVVEIENNCNRYRLFNICISHVVIYLELIFYTNIIFNLNIHEEVDNISDHLNYCIDINI